MLQLAQYPHAWGMGVGSKAFEGPAMEAAGGLIGHDVCRAGYRSPALMRPACAGWPSKAEGAGMLSQGGIIAVGKTDTQYQYQATAALHPPRPPTNAPR
ncbi:hypothetical protein RJ45_05685 [Photobacterium gaetbulicola]|uniref:Uncharacterized protein n=1 Tax=Photobacterium gaetbulicola TaxID=1295392 RepID=A0A0B9H6T4_9GAMM|nr:hypothetical protein RJ45_05685 [Photobacterium gaetbulicola]